MSTKRASPLAAALAVLLLAVAGGVSAITELDVLQFALNLEYLEGNFYSCAIYGVPLNSSLSGGGPAPLGCAKAHLTYTAHAIGEEIAVDEITHVAFLRAAITAAGGSPVPQPLIDIGAAFEVAANAAVGATLSPAFTPYANDLFFYYGAFIFEDVGATAYHGALSALTTPAYISAAGGILGTEAYHAGAIRTLLIQMARQTIFPYNVQVYDVANAISALRAAASGAAVDQGTTFPGTAKPLLVPTDDNAVIFTRTPQQVLRVVYLGGDTSGGFFPQGLNGAITSAV